MLSFITRFWYKLRHPRHEVREIDPDEIFLDSSNLPEFNRHQFEGRLERPISRKTILSVSVVFILVLLVVLGKSFTLQVRDGALYTKQSTQNRLRHTLMFGSRGVFYDRTGAFLAWNVIDKDEPAFSKRKYVDIPGLSSLLGYLKYPSKDKAGFYYKVDFEPQDGVEKFYNEFVAPQHGIRIVETDVHGVIQSESVTKPPKDGTSVTLTVDARLQEKLYTTMEGLAKEKGFQGGAAVIMDVENGELLSFVNFPEYDSQVLTDGTDTSAIKKAFADSRKPFLNRVTKGLYTPGSVVKPFMALAALEEGIITPEKEIVSTGSISIPNPFDPSKPTVFKDWKAHGAVDMRRALAVSSDVYFYEIGGGFEGQKGLGIANIEKYSRMFGFGTPPPGDIIGEAGVIPTPEWKREQFKGEAWNIGNTYHTAIGQYGFQVTPLQMVRAVSAIANGGKLLEPRLTREEDVTPLYSVIPIQTSSFTVVREGMHEAVTAGGTASALLLPGVSIAGKTGTAELGTLKKLVNSWVVGFFPYEKPRYAFAIVMEKGSHDNTVGAAFVGREFMQWLQANVPEYLKAE
ncbi:MAG: penicillin-binding transpeptidase domain-containing protein [bacterium]|nr:penicillin-binding transpeptidase domain-containing protein [bacterium]